MLLRLHRESRYIPRIFTCLKRIARGVRAHLCVQVDRPSPDVVCALSRELRALPDTIKPKVIEADEPLVSNGEHFMRALQKHYAALLEMGPIEAASLWDDDMWFEAAGVREMRSFLQIFEHDRVEAQTLFLWDHSDRYNSRFPTHLSAILFRVIAGDQFPPGIMTHCPREATFSEAWARMRNPLINAGYLEEKTRKAAFARAKRAGKIDKHSMTLVKPPQLEIVHGFVSKQPDRPRGPRRP